MATIRLRLDTLQLITQWTCATHELSVDLLPGPLDGVLTISELALSDAGRIHLRAAECEMQSVGYKVGAAMIFPLFQHVVDNHSARLVPANE